jgi:hypothetical protein
MGTRIKSRPNRKDQTVEVKAEGYKRKERERGFSAAAQEGKLPSEDEQYARAARTKRGSAKSRAQSMSEERKRTAAYAGAGRRAGHADR